jgi:hypothetical protein
VKIQIRDPVHGFISLREKEVRLVNSAVMQRLRGIRQLAMANLVYPGALHTRFDHSLGVLHVAGHMAERFELDSDDTELVRLAALLHDVGHGPFSHVSEQALERYADRTSLAGADKREKIHELVTAEIIRSDGNALCILGQETCERVARLLAGKYGERALKAIVCGPLDADKQDYLLRDSRFCGVEYGVFDLHQMHRSLRLRGPDEDREIMVDPDGVHALEQYVLAKYYMTANVYRHKVRVITDQMLVRAIELGVDKDGIDDLRTLYAYDGSARFVGRYQHYDDARLLHEFGPEGRYCRAKCADLLGRLRERRLLKRVFTARTRDLGPGAAEAVSSVTRVKNAAQRRNIEAKLAESLNRAVGNAVDADLVILHVFDLKSVRESARNDEKGIMVDMPSEPRPFDQESALFASIDEKYVEEYVEVYAPVSWNDRTERARILDCADGPVRDILSSLSVPEIRCSSGDEGLSRKEDTGGR